MRKLLSANFSRLWKDKIFWLCMGAMFLTGISFPIVKYIDTKQSAAINNIDNGFFGCALFIGIIMAVFCSMFLGTEYSDGTIRNKIIIGHKRTTIYMSNFVTTSSVSVLMCAAFFLPYLCIGIPLLGFFVMNLNEVMLFMLAVLVLAIAFSSIFTLISMLDYNKTVTAVVCILISFALLFTGTVLHSILTAPEILSSYSMGADGKTTMSQVENSKYLKGTKREIVQALYDINLGGQAIQCSMTDAENLPLLPIYSVVIILLTTSGGLFFFTKKELK